MKSIILAFLLLSCTAFAQSDISAQGSSIVLQSNNSLSCAISPVTFVDTSFVSGLVSFNTGTLSSGTITNGGTFNSGGTFIIVITGSGTVFNGTIDNGATWQRVTLANGTHYYLLSGSITGTRTGAFTLQTGNTGLGNFNGSSQIVQFSIHLN